MKEKRDNISKRNKARKECLHNRNWKKNIAF